MRAGRGRVDTAPLQLAFRRKDFFAQALGPADVEFRLGVAKFFQGAADRPERVVEIAWLTGQ